MFAGDHWNNISRKLNKAAVIDLLTNFKITNEELSSKKKKEDGLIDSIASIKVSKIFT